MQLLVVISGLVKLTLKTLQRLKIDIVLRTLHHRDQ